MSDADVASADDVDQLVALQVALFNEDAGVHERHVDLTWPVREGRADFERLLADPRSVVVVSRSRDSLTGFLVGYLTAPSSSRLPVTYAMLRSLYVSPDARGTGAADSMTERFVEWARSNGAVQAIVDAYAANERAQRFYARHGFGAFSVQRVRDLETD